MIDFQNILSIIPAVGVMIALVYYTQTLRNAERTRYREQIFLRSQMHDLPYFEAWAEVMSIDFKNRREWNEKVRFNPKTFAKYIHIGTRYQNIGVLLKEGMVDPEILFQVFSARAIMRTWEKLEPMEIELRERCNDPTHYAGFEYLYNEAKKRYPEINTKEEILDE